MKVLLLIFLVPGLLFADGLWDKGQKWYTDSLAWQPMSMQSVFLISDDKGKEEEKTLESYTIDYSTPDPTFVLVTSTKNGKDQTEKRQKELKEQQKKGKTDSGMDLGFEAADHPLNPAISAQVTYTLKGTSWIGVYECLEYEFILKKPKGKLIGSVFLSKSTGIPVRLAYTLSPLPAMTSELWIVQNYSAVPDGMTLLSSMEFSGSGGILMIQKKITGKMSFSGYVPKS